MLLSLRPGLNACLCTITCCASLLMSQDIVSAQSARRSKHLQGTSLRRDIPQSPATKAGGAIVSFPSDPLMSAKQEQTLIETLRKESPFAWGPEIPLSELAKDLSAHFPVFLDRRSLEEIGLDADVGLHSGLLINGGAPSPKRKVMKAPWWQQDPVPSSSGRPILVVDVMNRLRDADLTLMICRGQVIITTEESAEDDLATRIYDITPMAMRIPIARWGAVGSTPTHGETEIDFQHLIDTIQTTVDPNIWEQLGGPATIVLSPMRQRYWLVVSAPTMTHWKVQHLLDRLNQ